MASKTHIIIHHSATADSGSVSWQAIRNYHVNTLGWRDVGYHMGIELIGDRYEALMGRALNEVGAHCKEASMNTVGVGVCLVGNFDVAPPSPAMLKFAARHVRGVADVLHIPIAPDRIYPHRKYATYKSCPGTQFPWDLFMRMLEGA